MNTLVARHAGKEIHVILDNLSTHKPKRDMWLKRHSNVHFHYTPTHASWLNQIEIWFSILAAKSLGGASFNSVKELVGPHRPLHRRLQPERPALRVDQERRAPEAAQALFRGLTILGTSTSAQRF